MKKFLALALVFVASIFFFMPHQANFVSADTLNQTDSSVTVSGIVDVTLNGTTIAFGSVTPGTANSSATTGFPINVTIWPNTNTITTIKVNGTDLTGAGTLTMRNVTYANETLANKTEMNETFTSGSWLGQPYSNWVSIADPSSAVSRYVHWWVSIPALQAKGAYTGKIYIQVVDAG